MSEKCGGTDGAFPLAPSRKIIPASETSAWRDGYRFLAEAEQKYAEEAARGYEVGKAEGARDTGLLVAETAVEVDRYLASLDKKIAALAFDIVRCVLSDFDDAELVARATRTALSEFREAKAITIKVHPDAKDAVAAVIADQQAEAEWSQIAIEIYADPDITPQRCVLMTEFAVVEATVDAQLDAIAQAMQIKVGNS